MDNRRFDALVKSFGTSTNRRRALFGGMAGAIAVLRVYGRGGAQATPPADGSMAENGSTLFVQTAAGGTFLPNTLASPEAGAHGTHLLTLSGHPGQTIAFSNRPERNFDQVETATFLDALGFTPVNPPNAALVVSTPSGEDDILVLELLNPIYDDAADLLLYEANILGEYAGEGLAPVADRQEDDELASEFGHASLFIDDCWDLIACIRGITYIGPLPGGAVHQCWTWVPPRCYPCSTTLTDLHHLCNGYYPDCRGNCDAV